MRSKDDGEFAALLTAYRDGDTTVAPALFALVYDDLRELARAYMRHERPDHTLQATALVNELYLRLGQVAPDGWQDRAHFFVVAAQQMRYILVDHARRVRAVRRGGGCIKLSLDELSEAGHPHAGGDLLALDEALRELERHWPRECRVVELRYFAGLTEREAAAVLGLSVSTVKRHWEFARALLLSELRAAG